ncbi:MAG: DUF2177 family protein [Candidatus Roizmanbacteria bacterium]|nr:DUF2177 family protein [Candidatus Roizmanbacteria bacterium]
MFIKLYLITLPIFFGIDMVWLGLISKNFYSKHLGYLMTPHVNWIAALLFYLLFIGGLVLFVISPALEKNNWMSALFMGMAFGLMTYATYDLTNLATIKNWPLIVTIVDLIWGMTLSAGVSVASYFLAKKLGL